jgi:hypothetical protein
MAGIFLVFTRKNLFLKDQAVSPDQAKTENSLPINKTEAKIESGLGNSPREEISPSSYEDLLSKIKSNDYCSLASSKFLTYSPDDVIKVIFQTPNEMNPDIDADRTSEYIISHILNSGKINPLAAVDTNDIIEFYRAIAFGGLLIPEEGTKKFLNYKTAEDILLSLETKDETNGAFPFFRAAVMLNEGATKEEIKPLLVKAMRAPKFENYLKYVAKRIMQRGFTNSALYVAGQSVTSSLRIINYMKVMDILKEMVSSGDTSFAQLALNFSKKLRTDHLPKGGRFDFFEWDILDYAFGELLNYRALKILNPGKNIPFAKGPTEFLTFYDEPIYKETFRINNGRGEPVCDQQKIDIYVANEKQIYSDYIRSLKQK